MPGRLAAVGRSAPAIEPLNRRQRCSYTGGPCCRSVQGEVSLLNGGATLAIAPERMGIGLRRHFTIEGRDPYDDVAWERRDARISNYRDGTVAFEQPGV